MLYLLWREFSFISYIGHIQKHSKAIQYSFQ
jgi:hypothetical protein